MSATDHEAAIRGTLRKACYGPGSLGLTIREHDKAKGHLDALVGLLQQAEQDNLKALVKWNDEANLCMAAVARAERAEQERDSARRGREAWEEAHNKVNRLRADAEARVRVLEEALREILGQKPGPTYLPPFVIARAALADAAAPPEPHRTEMGDDGMIHCRACGAAWWPHDPGRSTPDYVCDRSPAVAPPSEEETR